MQTRKVVIGGIALIAILVSIGLITRGLRSPGEEIQSEIDLELGMVLGDEIIRQLDGKGSVIIITRPLAENIRHKAMEEVRALRKAIQSGTGIKVKDVVELTADDYAEISPMFRGRGLPHGALQRLMDEYPNAAALVSLAGQPLMHEALEEMEEPRPKIFCLAVGTLPLRGLFEWSVLDAAAVRGENSEEGGSPRYEVFTQETMEYLEF